MFDSDPKRRYGLRETIKAAWEELGLKRNPRGDCGFLAGICEFLENWNDGQRQPSNLAYSLKGFKVVNSATVHKVVFAENDAGAPKASAAMLKDGRQFRARKEIVLLSWRDQDSSNLDALRNWSRGDVVKTRYPRRL